MEGVARWLCLVETFVVLGITKMYRFNVNQIIASNYDVVMEEAVSSGRQLIF